MATAILSSATLCPINFKLFDVINAKLKNIEAALLYSKIKFHQTHSKIKKENKICIARSREQMADWFGFGLKKTDRLLSLLEKSGLIQKTTGTWYGKKRLFITASEVVDQSPINIKILESISQQTTSIKESLIFSKIAFRFANTKIQHDGHRWCAINRQELSVWIGCSIRTTDTLLKNLISTGMVLRKNFTYRGKSQGHFHIPAHVIESLQIRAAGNTELQTEININKNKLTINKAISSPVDNIFTHSQNYRSPPAKKTLPIRIRSKEKQTINNTSQLVQSERVGQCDITFSKIGTELSIRQLKYLEAALNRTLERRKVIVSNPKELWHQLKFSIINPDQRLKTTSFQHTVSRFMKILSDGNWKTPIGFYKHSEVGQQIKSEQEDRLQAWNQQKEEECKNAMIIQQQLNQHFSTNLNHTRVDEATQQALHLAKQIRYLAISQNNQQGRAEIIDVLGKQLHGFLRQGANKEQVLVCLKG